jgi:hypothetical protein
MMLQILLRDSMAMPYLTLLDAGFSLQGPELNLCIIHLGFLVDKVEFSEYFTFFFQLSFHKFSIFSFLWSAAQVPRDYFSPYLKKKVSYFTMLSVARL